MAGKADSKSTHPSKPNSTAKRRKKASPPVRPKRQPRKVVEADEIVIRDRRGRKRIHLGTHGGTGAARIWLCDREENVMLCLIVDSAGDSAHVSLWTPDGYDTVRIGVSQTTKHADVSVTHIDPKKRGVNSSSVSLNVLDGQPSLRVTEKSGESHKFSGKVVLA